MAHLASLPPPCFEKEAAPLVSLSPSFFSNRTTFPQIFRDCMIAVMIGHASQHSYLPCSLLTLQCNFLCERLRWLKGRYHATSKTQLCSPEYPCFPCCHYHNGNLFMITSTLCFVNGNNHHPTISESKLLSAEGNFISYQLQSAWCMYARLRQWKTRYNCLQLPTN